MNPRLRPNYLVPFNKVAGLIRGTDPPIWLAEQLWRCSWQLSRDRNVEKWRPSRAQMRKSLVKVEEAVFVLTEALSSWVREFLDPSSDPIADPEHLVAALGDFGYRAFLAQNSPDLTNKAGVTKPGPGKARTEEMTPHTLCAVIIWEAWKHVHKAEPKPNNRRAAGASEAYWRAVGGERHYAGEEPLAFWRHHLKKAAASSVKNFRTEWGRHLNEGERRWKRSNSVSSEG